MKKFILGMTDESMLNATLPCEGIVEFSSRQEAAEISAEWCIVHAETLEEAKDKYLGVYEAWYNKGFKGGYPTDKEIEIALKNL